ncbi:MAG: FkbM family methyltransferase [Chloroflexi bacterium]|nr:FkbM family methyltransferase [Chloroflexota bacterium]
MSFIIDEKGGGLKRSAFGYYLKSLFTLVAGIRNPGILFRLMTNRSNRFAGRVNLRNGQSFLVFSLLDVWVLKETILDRQYEQVSVPLLGHWTVIDIGAALGDYSVWAASQLMRGRLIAVEPYPPAVSMMRTNLEKNKVLNVEIFPGAVTGSNGNAYLKISEGKLVKNSTANLDKGAREVMVQTVTMEELLNRFSISKCDYLKMDCEGGEYDIFFSTSKETLARIDRVCLEVHDTLVLHTHRELIDFFVQNGYTTRLTDNPVHSDLAFLYAERTNITEAES